MIERKIFDSLINNKIRDSKTILESLNQNYDYYDFFISYSSKDKKYAMLVKQLLENMYIDDKKSGYRVYVDYDDSRLDPKCVSGKTAQILSSVIKKAKSIIYIHSQGSSLSPWCPWELGYGQGLNKPISVLELYDNMDGFERQAYLELYPTIVYKTIEGKSQKIFWIHDRKDNRKYINIYRFINGENPYLHKTGGV